jgi:Uma2 family endonuclease
MANATQPAGRPAFSHHDPLAVPTVEAWRAMTADARMDVQVAINAALTAAADLMSEGKPHKRVKSSAMDALGLHFKAIGRTVYLAEELAVLYPGEQGFSPDVLVVLDVEQPERDERMAWVVADEGKGPDLVLEVLHKGNRDKDLVQNVARYAHLGIPEYFVYDRLRQQIHGYRLPAGASSYRRIVPQLGHYRSDVLGLNLAILGDDLRFLSGEAALPVSADLIDRLQGVMASLEAKADQAEARGFREAVLALLQARAIPVSDEARARVEACMETTTLRRWLLRATTAASVDEIFSAEPPPAD